MEAEMPSVPLTTVSRVTDINISGRGVDAGRMNKNSLTPSPGLPVPCTVMKIVNAFRAHLLSGDLVLIRVHGLRT